MAKVYPLKNDDGVVVAFGFTCPGCGCDHCLYLLNPKAFRQVPVAIVSFVMERFNISAIMNIQWQVRQLIYQTWRAMRKDNNNPMRAASIRLTACNSRYQLLKHFFASVKLYSLQVSEK